MENIAITNSHVSATVKYNREEGKHLAKGGNGSRKTVPLEDVCDTPWKLNGTATIVSYLVMAMEVRGVVGAPFQTMVLPQVIARAEFQP